MLRISKKHFPPVQSTGAVVGRHQENTSKIIICAVMACILVFQVAKTHVSHSSSSVSNRIPIY